MATAKGAEYDKIQGLDLGADYYLTKPFGVMEFVSCVKAVLRRSRPKTAQALLRSGTLTLDPAEHTVTADGTRVELTYKEFELLRLFLSHPGMAFTRDQLMEKVWDVDYCGETRTVDMHIRTLRQKLGENGEHIETVRGVGYRWRRRRIDRERSSAPFSPSASRCSRAACCSSWAASTASMTGMQEHQLGDELRIAAAAVETNGSTYLEKIKSDRFRVTWIASDGTVLYDTQADAAQMENHARARGGPRGAGDRHGQLEPLQRDAAAKDRLQREPPARTAPCCACPPAAPRWALLLLGAAPAHSARRDRAARALEPAREPSGQAHRRAARTRSTSSIRWKTTPMRSSLRSCGASTASADRSTPSSPSCGRKQTNSHRSPPA